MRCHICDADSDTVVIEHGEFSPCAECQSAIFECLQGYPDNKVSDIDETLDEDFDAKPAYEY
jgi:hypothetical protein